jgi:hypothetical protein
MRRHSVINFYALTVVALVTSFRAVDAATTYTNDPSILGAALTSDPALVTGASFVSTIPDARHAVSTTAMQSFPTAGASFAILSSGGGNHSLPTSLIEEDSHVRGANDYDVSILRIDLDVPAAADCLGFDFRLVSNESIDWGEFYYDDAFIAELNESTWSTDLDGNLWDPDNFALLASGRPVTARPPAMTKANAEGTGYQLGTARLLATTVVSDADSNGVLPGNNSLYLSIFDQGDAAFDSAVFIDGLHGFTATSTGCVSGPRTFTSMTATPRYIEDTDLYAGYLTARLMDRSGNGVEGKTVDFYLHDFLSGRRRVCSVVTGADGVARCPDPDVVSTGGYEARFEGDLIARPSQKRAYQVGLAGQRIL